MLPGTSEIVEQIIYFYTTFYFKTISILILFNLYAYVTLFRPKSDLETSEKVIPWIWYGYALLGVI